MQRIEVVCGNKLKKGDSTQGIVRELAFESEEVLVSRSRVAGDVVSGWHHHGARNLYGFLVSGRLRLEYGRDGREAAQVGAGDFFHIPAGLVHRDLNPDKQQELIVVGILVGKGPPVINVQSPQANSR